MLFIPDEGAMKWVKAGIECVDGEPCVGIVGTRRWSDWSSVPLEEEEGGKVTIQVEKQEKLDSLWIYVVDEETGRKMEVRKITWFFRHDILDQKTSKVTSDNRRLLIGVYAARPTVPAGEGREHEELVIKLEGFEVKLFDN